RLRRELDRVPGARLPPPVALAPPPRGAVAAPLGEQVREEGGRERGAATATAAPAPGRAEPGVEDEELADATAHAVLDILGDERRNS
ncbi:hypothetical protein VM98_35125, partial [Streptomyces rubellomurinus subsp. indigoferus]